MGPLVGGSTFFRGEGPVGGAVLGVTDSAGGLLYSPLQGRGCGSSGEL